MIAKATEIVEFSYHTIIHTVRTIGRRTTYVKEYNKIELAISATVPSDSGVYQCVAVNSAGEIWAAGRLQVNTSRHSPATPTSLKCHAISPVKILISWEPPKSLLYTSITAYTVHYSPVGKSDYVLFDKYDSSERLFLFDYAYTCIHICVSLMLDVFDNRRWQGGSFATRTRQLHVRRSDGTSRAVYKLYILCTRME